LLNVYVCRHPLRPFTGQAPKYDKAIGGKLREKEKEFFDIFRKNRSL